MKVRAGAELPPLPSRLVEEGELGPIVNAMMNKVTKKPGQKSKGVDGASDGQDYGRGKRTREVSEGVLSFMVADHIHCLLYEQLGFEK